MIVNKYEVVLEPRAPDVLSGVGTLSTTRVKTEPGEGRWLLEEVCLEGDQLEEKEWEMLAAPEFPNSIGGKEGWHAAVLCGLSVPQLSYCGRCLSPALDRTILGHVGACPILFHAGANDRGGSGEEFLQIPFRMNNSPATFQ